MTVTSTCWVCGASETTRISAGAPIDALKPEDLRISDKRYGLTLPLNQCKACGFVFARTDDVTSLTSLYAQLQDEEYGASARGRRRQMAHLLHWAADDLPRSSRLLDVGAASGILLHEAKALGFDGVGVEPSASLAARATEEGLTVHAGVLPHAALGESTFDIVTLVDVIEHVDDPVGLLRQCRRYLRGGGRLLVVTPDRSSIAARVLGARWWHRRLAHVGYFDRRTLTAALQHAGFVAERWSRPRWYFPVGYLATRVLQYIPGLGNHEVETAKSDGVRGLVVPLNLFDSYAVVARAS